MDDNDDDDDYDDGRQKRALASLFDCLQFRFDVMPFIEACFGLFIVGRFLPEHTHTLFFFHRPCLLLSSLSSKPFSLNGLVVCHINLPL